jgi:hypothetical protein
VHPTHMLFAAELRAKSVFPSRILKYCAMTPLHFSMVIPAPLTYMHTYVQHVHRYKPLDILALAHLKMSEKKHVTGPPHGLYT